MFDKVIEPAKKVKFKRSLTFYKNRHRKVESVYEKEKIHVKPKIPLSGQRFY